MKAPWTDKTGLAKLVAILATTLLIALGLCGVNYATFLVSSSKLGPQMTIGLLVTGYIELAAIILSIAGLVLTGLVWLIKAISNAVHNRK